MAFLAPNINPEDVFFKDVLATLLRNKGFVIRLFLAITIGVYIALMLRADQYESKALLLVQLGRENSQAPITADEATVFTNGVQKEEINSYVLLLYSHNLIEEVVNVMGIDRFIGVPPKPESLFGQAKYYGKSAARWTKNSVTDVLILVGLKTRLDERSKAILLLERSLTVARERDSNVIHISLRLQDPTLARDAISTLISIYSDRHLKFRKNSIVELAFELQAVSYKRQLEEMQIEMNGIRHKWGITSIEEQRKILVEDLMRAEYSLGEKEALAAQLAEEEVELLLQLLDLPELRTQAEVVGPNPHAEVIKARIVDLTMERAEKSSLYNTDASVIKLIDNNLKRLNTMLKGEELRTSTDVTTAPNPMVDDIRLSIRRVRVETKGLEAAIEVDRKHTAELSERLSDLNEGAGHLEMAALEYTVLESSYLSNAERVEKAKSAQVLESQRIANVSVMGIPTLETIPVAPKRMLLMGVGVLVALVLSLSLVLFKEWFFERVREARVATATPPKKVPDDPKPSDKAL